VEKHATRNTQHATRKKKEEKPLKSSKSQNTPKTSGSAKKPETMEALLKKTGYQLHGFKRGEIVEGKIVSLSPKEILIDIGGKTEGVVARKELPYLKNLIKTLKIGDQIIARVLLPESEKGLPLLSIRESAEKRKWQILAEKASKEAEVKVLGRKQTRGGLLVDYQDLRGFIPQSQLDSQFAVDPQALMGREIKVKILEVEAEKNRLVFSQKAVTQKEKIAQLKKHLKKIKIGQVFEAEITGLVPFGLFCQVNGLEGLIHISEIAWEKVDQPADYYQVGDKVKVKVLGIDEREGKLNLSIKQLIPDPWQKVSKKYKKEQIVTGKVTRVSGFGIFVSLEKGVEGLIHISKIPPSLEFKEGEKVECVIEKIDQKNRRISLSYLPKEKPVGYK